MKIKQLLFLMLFLLAKPCLAQDAYIGEIRAFCFNFPTRNWLRCEGQLLSIQQNSALFAILGTTYGGNGQTNFALPDLRNRVAVGAVQGNGTTNYSLGIQSGTESIMLSSANLPAHSHTANLKVSSAAAITSTPIATSSLAVSKQVVNTLDRTVLKYAPPTTTTISNPIKAVSTSDFGSSTPTAVATTQPVLASLYAICVYGIFPPHP